MATLDTPEPEIDAAVQADLVVHAQVKVTDEHRSALRAWLSAAVREARQKRDDLLPRVRTWRKTLAGERPRGPLRSGASNLSVPLTMWANTAVRARLVEGVLESSPLTSARPVPGRRGVHSNQTIANDLANFLSVEILNQRGLDGRTAISLMASEMTSLGTSALKVFRTEDRVRKVGVPGSEPSQIPLRGRVKWEFVSFLDLIYLDGYGTDTQAMPLIGHEIERTWSEIVEWGALGHYDKAAVDRVSAFYDGRNEHASFLHIHQLAELYFDYDIDGDGIQEALLVDWHIGAEEPLRIVYSPYPDGRRPIVIARFDYPPDLTHARGQGVPEKLEGSQEEVDAIHNIAIESGKRAINLTVLKAGRRAAEELGPDAPILPSDILVTEDPSEDVVAIQMGDPRAAESLIALEEHTRMYVTRILGLDESRIGNVESGKRVPASLGLSTMREGRVVIKAALNSLADALTEASYLTIDLWRRYLPEEALYSALGEESALALMDSVFGVTDETTRRQFILRVNAQDAATIQETKRAELISVNQFLFAFYDRLVQLVMALSNPNVPPQAKPALLLVVERMERGVETLLNTLESIPNPDELLVRVGEMRRLLEEAVAVTSMQSMAAPMAGAPGAAGAAPPEPGGFV